MAAGVGFVLSLGLKRAPSEWHHRVWFGTLGELMLLVSIMLPALVMGRLERRSLGDYGLPGREALGKLFWVGMAWGLAALTALLGVMRAAKVFYFGGIVLHGERLLKFAVYYAVFFLVVGLFEEFFMRGYSLHALARGMGFWPAAVLTSVLFGAVHLGNEGEAWIGALAAGAIGFFFCLTLRRTGSLWFAIGFHTSWDWGETYLYSVPNSGTTASGHLTNSSFQGSRWLTGGSVGPEGSVLLFVLLAVLWIVFDRTYREAKYPQRLKPHVQEPV
jgi:membrane protease YdiL (CAAX protease family)